MNPSKNAILAAMAEENTEIVNLYNLKNNINTSGGQENAGIFRICRGMSKDDFIREKMKSIVDEIGTLISSLENEEKIKEMQKKFIDKDKYMSPNMKKAFVGLYIFQKNIFGDSDELFEYIKSLRIIGWNESYKNITIEDSESFDHLMIQKIHMENSNFFYQKISTRVVYEHHW